MKYQAQEKTQTIRVVIPADVQRYSKDTSRISKLS
jgi:hypothetical protein